jgi:hypothetical protein
VDQKGLDIRDGKISVSLTYEIDVTDIECRVSLACVDVPAEYWFERDVLWVEPRDCLRGSSCFTF